jgi:hypothetical protein
MTSLAIQHNRYLKCQLTVVLFDFLLSLRFGILLAHGAAPQAVCSEFLNNRMSQRITGLQYAHSSHIEMSVKRSPMPWLDQLQLRASSATGGQCALKRVTRVNNTSVQGEMKPSYQQVITK